MSSSSSADERQSIDREYQSLALDLLPVSQPCASTDGVSVSPVTSRPHDDYRLVSRTSLESVNLHNETSHHLLQSDILRLSTPPTSEGYNSTTTSTREDDAKQPNKAPSMPQQWPPSHRPKRTLLLDWSEEIISITIGIIFTVLAIAILVYMQERAQADWKLPIQPNSLIAVFATLSRMAMIYPLSECIGHLKWAYFEKTRPLSMINAFDVASRGPIGSVKFLWQSKGTCLLASCAAMLTILLLAFQPFMQQALNFSSRLVPRPDPLAVAKSTTTWLLHTGQNGSMGDSFMAKFTPVLSSTIENLVQGETSDESTNIECPPTSACEFPEIQTLALCPVCKDFSYSGNAVRNFKDCHMEVDNVTFTTLESFQFELERRMFSRAHMRCSMNPFCLDESWASKDTCGSWSSNLFEYELEMVNQYNIGKLRFRLFPYTQGAEGFSEWVLNTAVDLRLGPYWPSERPRPTMHGNTTRMSNETYPWDSEAMPFQIRDNQTLQACTTTRAFPRLSGDHAFNYMYDVYSDLIPQDPLSIQCFTSSTELSRYTLRNSQPWNTGILDPGNGTNGTDRYITDYSFSNHFGDLNGTVTICNFRPCAKGYNISVKDGKLRKVETYSTDKFDLVRSDDTTKQSYFRAEGMPSHEFSWSRSDDASFGALGKAISDSFMSNDFYKDLYSNDSDRVFGGNFTLLSHNLAREVSILMQGTRNPNYVNITGNKYNPEVYVQVRWPWIILPLATIILSIAILALTIIDSRRRPYLLKNSIIAALFVHLQGWEKHEQLEFDKWGRYSAGSMLQVSKGTKVTMGLGESSGEGIKLKKE